MRRSNRDSSNSLAAKVTERLRRAILDAEFELGEALSEDKLATALGVSRTPVREALTALQMQGLIAIEPQRGSFVFSPSEDEVAELCAFRCILEIEALRMSFANDKAGTIASMRRASEAMSAAMHANDRLAVARADGAFHESLFEGSGNHYLVEAYRPVSGRVAALRAHNLTGMSDVRNRSMAEHEAIIGAFSRGDLAQAEAILAGHVMKMREAFRAATERAMRDEPKPLRRRTSVDIVLNDS